MPEQLPPELVVRKDRGGAATTGIKPFWLLIFGEVLRDKRGVGRRFKTRAAAERAGAAELIRRRFQSQVPHE